MLCLRSCTLTYILSSPSSTYPISPLHRLLSAAVAAPAASSSPAFAIEQYVVDTCGLKASTKLTHLKCPTKPNAVLSFLAGLGLSSSSVASLSPRTQSSSAPGWRESWPLTSSGSPATTSHILRSRASSRTAASSFAVDPSSPNYRSTNRSCLLGTYEILLRLLKQSSSLLGYSLEKFSSSTPLWR
uniref:Uncharacterized protein n=2 Tax=Avena sativa TaxID=4498 RepID=A0ACD5Z850_AVESA